MSGISNTKPGMIVMDGMEGERWKSKMEPNKALSCAPSPARADLDLSWASGRVEGTACPSVSMVS